jgi:exodeoxyribonuclease VII large subunit
MSDGMNMDAQSASKVSSEQQPWPVSRLATTLKDWIDRLGYLWIEGELSQLRFNPTNFFGSLRDLQVENSVEIHSWDLTRIPRDLKQGDRVVALIKPAFWGKNGKLSMQVMEIRKVGLGELLERIERLRAQLTAEGLTAIERKQPIPFLPNKIGLITGANSDAEKDVLKNTHLRWPDAQFRVINTLVQGDRAAGEVIAAIKELDNDPEVDVIIIARGGGSFLDLVVFSDEALVRAAAAAKTPIISAIGHENDRPVLDDVADLRASTPTDAAKRVVPDVAEERANLNRALGQIFNRVNQFVSVQADLIAAFRSRPVLANPYQFIEDHEADAMRDRDRSRELIGNFLHLAEVRIENLRNLVTSLSPQKTLDRGYSVVRDAAGHVIADGAKVKSGTKLNIRLAKGEIGATAD